MNGCDVNLDGLEKSQYLDKFNNYAKREEDLFSIVLTFDGARVVTLSVEEYQMLSEENRERIKNA